MEYKGTNNPKLTWCVSPENEALCVKMGTRMEAPAPSLKSFFKERM